MEGEPALDAVKIDGQLGDRFRRRGQRQVSWRIYWTFGRRGLLRRNDHRARGRRARISSGLSRPLPGEGRRTVPRRQIPGPRRPKSIEGCLQPLVLARSVFQCPRDSVCVAGDRAKIRPCGLIRFGTALLPVAQSAERNMKSALRIPPASIRAPVAMSSRAVCAAPHGVRLPTSDARPDRPPPPIFPRRSYPVIRFSETAAPYHRRESRRLRRQREFSR